MAVLSSILGHAVPDAARIHRYITSGVKSFQQATNGTAKRVDGIDR